MYSYLPNIIIVSKKILYKRKQILFNIWNRTIAWRKNHFKYLWQFAKMGNSICNLFQLKSVLVIIRIVLIPFLQYKKSIVYICLYKRLTCKKTKGRLDACTPYTLLSKYSKYYFNCLQNTVDIQDNLFWPFILPFTAS